MELEALYDDKTNTLTYLIWNAETKIAAVIDPVMDYDPAASRVSNESMTKLLSLIKNKGLEPAYVLETHAHADHLSGAQMLKTEYPNCKIAIGRRITEVQGEFAPLYGLGEKQCPRDGSQFDLLLSEGDELKIGAETLKVFETSGHTPACCSFLIGDLLFTGDALFMPDFGVGRCDFPGGDANALYHSVHEKIYSLPDSTRIYVGHDYQPGGRELAFETSVAESKEKNKHIKASTSEAEFVEFRTTRDKQLNAPKLLLPSLQVNIQAGRLPEPESDGRSYLRIPISKMES